MGKCYFSYIHSFFYKQTFFDKDFKAEINQNFKNVSRTSLRLRVDYEYFYFAGLPWGRSRVRTPDPTNTQGLKITEENVLPL